MEEVNNKNTQRTAKTSEAVCSSCGLKGHKRRSNKLCPMNKNTHDNTTNQCSMDVEVLQPTEVTQTTLEGCISNVSGEGLNEPEEISFEDRLQTT